MYFSTKYVLTCFDRLFCIFNLLTVCYTMIVFCVLYVIPGFSPSFEILLLRKPLLPIFWFHDILSKTLMFKKRLLSVKHTSDTPL